MPTNNHLLFLVHPLPCSNAHFNILQYHPPDFKTLLVVNSSAKRNHANMTKILEYVNLFNYRDNKKVLFIERLLEIVPH